MSRYNPQCFANHMGAWMCEPRFFTQAVQSIKAGIMKPLAHAIAPLAFKDDPAEPPKAAADSRPYALSNGIAVLDIDGPMMKGWSKWGGTSTVALRQALRAAVNDADVAGIMLHIDSPGGHVAGTMELADDIRNANSVKPVHAHADDLIASASYWAGSSAGRLSINAIGEAGSIGTYCVVWDTSQQAADEGVKVLVIGAGEMKGAFAEGTEVTAEQIAYLRGLVEHANGHFLAGVKRNRKMSQKQLDAVATGRVYPAAQALDLGLVDAVQTYEQAMAALQKEAGVRPASRRARADALIGLADAEG